MNPHGFYDHSGYEPSPSGSTGSAGIDFFQSFPMLIFNLIPNTPYTSLLMFPSFSIVHNFSVNLKECNVYLIYEFDLRSRLVMVVCLRPTQEDKEWKIIHIWRFYTRAWLVSVSVFSSFFTVSFLKVQLFGWFEA